MGAQHISPRPPRRSWTALRELGVSCSTLLCMSRRDASRNGYVSGEAPGSVRKHETIYNSTTPEQLSTLAIMASSGFHEQVLERYLKLDQVGTAAPLAPRPSGNHAISRQGNRIQAEYIWIGGSGNDLRSKTKTLEAEGKPDCAAGLPLCAAWWFWPLCNWILVVCDVVWFPVRLCSQEP